MKKIVFFFVVFFNFSVGLFAQNLTISTSGESGTSGTNWSISGNVLQIASSGTATIHPSVITNHLTNTGNLTVDLPYVNVLRNININDNILYTGATNRTLTFKSATDIVIANGISITSSSASMNLVLRAAVNIGQRGTITLNAPVINTNGGHFWAGGGNTDVTWNSLIVGDTYARTWTNGESGFSLIGGSVTTNGGDIQMKGYSYYTGSTMGFNNGLKLDNTVVSSTSGSIFIDGTLNGKFTNGIASNMEANAGPIIIQSTSGSIQINGNGTDATGTSSGWRHGIRLSGTANYGVTIKTTSGSILIDGSANYINNTGTDSEGVALFATATDRLKIISQSGAITIKGSNTKESLGQMSNSIRFGVVDVSNAIRIGFDGTTTYSGSILIEGNSIYQRWTNTGAGSISVQTTGGLTIQPSGSSFTYMRAGTDGVGATLTYDDDWNFGTTLGSFTFGKTASSSALTFSNVLTSNGPITFNTGSFNLNADITTNGFDITINANTDFATNTTTRRTITTGGGNLIINADADANASGNLELDYLTLNPGTGNIVIRGETFNWVTTSISTKPYLNGTGSITLESSDDSFGQSLQTIWFQLDQDNNGMNNLSIGKSTNAFGISLDHLYTYNLTGSLLLNGTLIAINSAISSSLSSNNGIILNGTKITQNAGVTITTQGSNILYSSLNSPFTSGDDRGIVFAGTSGSKVILNANGGNINITSTTANSGVIGGSDRGIAFDYTDIISSGQGTITLTSDATNNANTTNAWGFQLSNTLIQSSAGAITINGTGGKNSLNARGIVTDASSLKIISNSGAITLNDFKPVGYTGNYYGIYLNPSTTNDILLGADGSNIVTSSSSVSIISDKAAFILNSTKNVKINTSGNVVVESVNSAFDYTSFTGLSISGNPTSVRIGKTSNTLGLILAGGISAGGPISIYGSAITLNDNISSSSNGDILLTGNTLSFASGKTITSGGKLLLQPQTPTTTIGIAGATGTLQLPASYFSTNFTNGFSSIQIGSNLQTGAISMNGFTLQDPIHFQTSGNLYLGGLPILGNNSVTLNTGIASITGTPTNYFKTTGTGKVIRTISNSTSFEFPIGNSSYNPLSISNNTGVSDDFSANVMDALYINGVSGTAVSSTAVNRTWDISKTNANAGSGVDFVFNWNAGEVANGSFYLPEMNHFSGSAWEVPVVSSSSVGTNALTVVGYTGTFSPFSIQEGSGLPVELTTFNANCTENATTINWQTASEHNSAYFDVEKSRDGNNWSLLKSIQAAGNSIALLDYSVVDSEKSTNVVYYRLNQVDQDGVSKIYGPISAACNTDINFNAHVFPNPTSGAVTLVLNTSMPQTIAVQLIGTDGKIYSQATSNIAAGSTLLPLEIADLKAGIYSVNIQGESTIQTVKVVVL